MDLKRTNRLAYVIEDEIYLAAIYVKALEHAGYRAISICDGQEAVEILSITPEPPDLIVLDLYLPRLSGTEILRYIRRDIRFARTRVISATADAAAVIGEVEAWSDLVLLKPIGFGQLRELAARFY